MYCPESEGENWKLHLRVLRELRDFLSPYLFVLIIFWLVFCFDSQPISVVSSTQFDL